MNAIPKHQKYVELIVNIYSNQPYKTYTKIERKVSIEKTVMNKQKK